MVVLYLQPLALTVFEMMKVNIAQPILTERTLSNPIYIWSPYSI